MLGVNWKWYFFSKEEYLQSKKLAKNGIKTNSVHWNLLRLHGQNQPEAAPVHRAAAGVPAGQPQLQVIIISDNDDYNDDDYDDNDDDEYGRLSNNLCRRIEEFEHFERKDVVR